eukprot:scaffold67699_cov30-Tisochrysis_lutea.AAC.3
MLVIRVINEPGCGHEHLCELSESSDVFNKGSRLHPALALSNEEDSVIVSKGDGGWIMKRCESAHLHSLGSEIAPSCVRHTCAISSTGPTVVPCFLFNVGASTAWMARAISLSRQVVQSSKCVVLRRCPCKKSRLIQWTCPEMFGQLAWKIHRSSGAS